MFPLFPLRLLFVVPLFFISITCCAQSSDEWIDRAVHKYNAFNYWSDTVTNSSNKDTYINAALNELKLIQSDLTNAKAGATMNQLQVIEYFDMNALYNVGFLYGKMGEETQSISYMRQVEQRMSKFTEGSFPLRYLFEGKNYVVNYSNFEPTRMEFYVGFGELLGRKGFYEEAKTNLLQATTFSYESNAFRFIAYDQLISLSDHLPLTNTEKLEYGSKSMYYFTQMDEQTRASLVAGFGASLFRYKQFFLLALEEETKKLNQSVSAYALSAAQSAQWMLEHTESFTEELECQLMLYDCYRAVLFCGDMDRQRIRTAYDYYKTNDPSNVECRDRGLAILGPSSITCLDFQWTADEYKSMNNDLFFTTYQQLAIDCTVEKIKQQKEEEKQAEIQRKQNERQYRRNNRDYFFYTGLNIFPLFGAEPDHGIAVNAGSNKFIVELSGLQVNRKKENFFDLDLREVDDVQDHYWDGYFAHVNFKFTTDEWTDGRGGYYVGFLLAKNERTFEPFQSTVTNVSTGATQLVHFSPRSSQSIFMFNYGIMAARVVGFDLFFGFGAAYNTFDGNDTKYWRNPDYLIEDRMMQYRVKNYWSFTMRMGLSIGIGWGN